MPFVARARDLKRRTRQVVKMLRPIRGPRDVGCELGPGPQPGTMVLWAHEGAARASEYRNARFRTRCHTLWCQYFEVWKEQCPEGELVLKRAYLTVFLVERHPGGLQEVVSVHSDPTDDSDVKRGPHLHVHRATHPIPKCHFALNYQYLEETLLSAQTLMEGFDSAIAILDAEVIERFCDGKAP